MLACCNSAEHQLHSRTCHRGLQQVLSCTSFALHESTSVSANQCSVPGGAGGKFEHGEGEARACGMHADRVARCSSDAKQKLGERGLLWDITAQRCRGNPALPAPASRPAPISMEESHAHNETQGPSQGISMLSSVFSPSVSLRTVSPLIVVHNKLIAMLTGDESMSK